MEKNIGKNVSSGAEKVENIAKATGKKSGVKSKSTPKKQTTKQTTNKAERTPAEKKERARAQKRVEAAKKRAEKKQKKIEARAAIKEKRLERKKMIAQKKLERKQKRMEKRAEIKNKRLEKRAERIARRELLKHETKAEKQKRIERQKRERLAVKRSRAQARERAQERKVAERRAAHERKAEFKKHKREQRTERKKQSRGFGGWLAAVVSLGVACLALATVVTAGAMRVNADMVAQENVARANLYEMLSVSEDLDNTLTKLRVSEGREEQRKLLCGVLVDTALLENNVERMPIDEVTSLDISSFINNTSSYCDKLLKKVVAGGSLTQTEKDTVSYLCSVNHDLTKELNALATTMTTKDLRAFMNGKEGSMSEQFAHMGQTSKREAEGEIDGFFTGAVKNVGKNQLAKYEEIDCSRAEELVRSYLEDYKIKKVVYTGEAQAHDSVLYNFNVTDEKDVEFFVQISRNGGKLTMMDMYEKNTDKSFDLNDCDRIAQKFLNSIGITDAEAVWYSDGGSVADIVYTSYDDGVCAYPDIVRVRVCECKGRVVGIDATNYWINHTERDLNATLSKEEARSAVNGLEPDEGRLALITDDGEEVLCYEFYCKGSENEYLVYINADNGEEVNIYTVREGMRGRYLV